MKISRRNGLSSRVMGGRRLECQDGIWVVSRRNVDGSRCAFRGQRKRTIAGVESPLTLRIGTRRSSRAAGNLKIGGAGLLGMTAPAGNSPYRVGIAPCTPLN